MEPAVTRAVTIAGYLTIVALMMSLEIHAQGGSAKINALEVHELKSAWTPQ